MADVKITLDAVTAQFLTSMKAAQAASENLTKSLDKVAASQKKTEAAASGAARATNQAAAAHQKAERTVLDHSKAVAKTILVYAALFQIAKQAGTALVQLFQAATQNIDDFKRGTIGAASAITNISEEARKGGATWEQVFQKNLKATQSTFLELERLAARYFASSTDLQLAYNTFAQRGIIIRRQELPLLAQLTDQILLLTQGQQSNIQVQEEIRSLVTGSLRPTAQLGQLLKAYGYNIKEVAAEIRATGSLKPLENILRGASAATNEIQKTFQAVKNGLEVSIRQVGRFSLDAFYNSLVGGVVRLTEFIERNKVQIVQFFALIGKSASNALDGIGKFLEKVIGVAATSKDSLDSAATFFASIEHFVSSTLALVNLLIDALKVLKESIKFIVDISGLGDAVSNQEYVPFSKSALQGLEKFKNWIVSNFPDAQEKVKALDKAIADMNETAAKANEEMSGKKFNQRRDVLKKAGLAGAAAIPSDTQALPSPTRIPFVPSPEQVDARQRLENSLSSARDRRNRAFRVAEDLEVVTDYEVAIQGLRRELALTESGFVTVGESIVKVRTIVKDMTEFAVKNFKAFVTGAKADFGSLAESIRQTVGGTLNDIFNNLDTQRERVEATADEAISTAERTTDQLKTEQVKKIREDALKLEEKINHEYKQHTDMSAQVVKNAQLEALYAEKHGDEKRKIAAQELLGYEIAQKAIRDEEEGRKRLYELEAVEKMRQIALANEEKLDEQKRRVLIEVGTTLEKERLRILQAQREEYGKILKANIDIIAAANKQRIELQNKLPRSATRTRAAEANDIRSEMARQLGEVQGRFDALLKRQNQNPAIGFIEPGFGPALSQSRKDVEKLKEIQAANEDLLDTYVRLLPAIEAVNNAVQRTADTMLTALTDSFEGKSTDFVSKFKSIADSLFKDAMQPFIDSLKDAVQDALKGLKDSLPKGMASSLGPAFVAGFALIASFVLGELLKGKGSSSAANPQVGIQSSEQVRGLIGGETQIPIGLVGESLQDALVPTNMLLSRIAAGVDRLALGGIDTAVIESSISAAISDALQIQLSAT